MTVRNRPTTRRVGTTMAAAGMLAVGGLALTGGAAGAQGAAARAGGSPTFSHPLRIDNRYLPLTTYTRCELRGTDDEGVRERTVRTVLPRTKTFVVAGKPVETVVIEDRAYADGAIVEITIDYFAQADDGTVYYFGEQVKNIRDGLVVDTAGTWLYGRDTDRLGVAMPSRPRLGQQWHLEDVPGLTTESDRVEETGLRTKVGQRVMTDVIRVQEFIQPEGEVEYKLYASGVGVVAEYPPGGRLFFVGCR